MQNSLGGIPTCVPILFGNWSNSSNAGVSNVNLNNNRSNSNTNVGFRCDSYYSLQKKKHTNNRGYFIQAENCRNISMAVFGRAGCCFEEPKPLTGGQMRRYGNLFEQIIHLDNFIQAFYNAQRRKRGKLQPLLYELDMDCQIQDTIQEIKTGTYRPKPYTVFSIYSPKKRVIYAPHFRDVVVQHAIYQVLYPILNPILIGQNYACRVGYGPQRTAEYLQKCMRKCGDDEYFLQLDLKKYFYRIDPQALRPLLERKIKDKKAVDLVMLFTHYDEPYGLPPGNLMNQIMASLYLNPLDHYVKEVLHICHYVRYVDDFILCGLSKEECHAIMAKLQSFLSPYHMTFSKHRIDQIRRGINFCGYRTWKTKKLVRKHSLYMFTRAVANKNIPVIVSLIGHAKRTNTLRHYSEKIMDSGMLKHLPAKVQKRLEAGARCGTDT